MLEVVASMALLVIIFMIYQLVRARRFNAFKDWLNNEIAPLVIEKHLASLPPEQQEPVILTVSKTGEYYLNIGDNLKDPVSDETVMKRISLVLKQKPQIPVLVRGDKDVDYGSVTTAMVLLQSAGVEKVGLMTEQP